MVGLGNWLVCSDLIVPYDFYHQWNELCYYWHSHQASLAFKEAPLLELKMHYFHYVMLVM